MRKVLLFSLLLIAGLLAGQLAPPSGTASEAVRLLTMLCLGFIMVHVGYEFDLDRGKLASYGMDAAVAASAAGLPWLLCAAYFALVLGPAGAPADAGTWTAALLAGCFAAPTSAGLLFAMLAAAGLSASWMFRKARVLAIFDDLATILLLVPLKALVVGWQWQLGVIVLVMAALLALAWRRLHSVRWPVSWPWVLGYAALLVGATEGVYLASKLVDEVMPIHIEVLLPAFALGCILARTGDPHVDDAREGHQDGPESPQEQRVSTLVAAAFMVLVGLSMPALRNEGGSWAGLLGHALVVTLLSNLGKLVPLLCYRRDAGWRTRLALCVGLWPRGEVGAGVLVVSLSYGLGGPMIAVATLSLALNLLLTGAFIVVVKRLLAAEAARAESAAGAAA